MALYENDQSTSQPQRWNPYESAVAQQATRSTFLNGVYQHMAVGLGITGLVAMFVASRPAALSAVAAHPIALFIAQILLVVGLSGFITKVSTPVAIAMFYGFAASLGLTLSGIFLFYTSQSIAATFFITGGTFAAMSAYGYTTKRDLTGVGNFLFMGLIGLVIASVVNIWVGSSLIQWITSCIGLLIFVGLTAYDTQRIKEMAYRLGEQQEGAGRIAILGALTLYLDFINLFMYLLEFTGNRRRD